MSSIRRQRRRGGSISPSHDMGRHSRTRPGRQCVRLTLNTVLLLLLLHIRRPGLDQGILDRSRYIYRKHWSSLHRPRNRFLPSLQHAFHAFPSLTFHQCVRVHEGAVQIASQVDCVWRAYILDNGVEKIERWKFAERGCLQVSARSLSHHREGR